MKSPIQILHDFHAIIWRRVGVDRGHLWSLLNMPELPEVESAVRKLRKCLPGRTISKVHIRWNSTIALPEPAEFSRLLKGACIEDVGRRAKYIVIRLNESPAREQCKKIFLLVHLRMSGSLDILSQSSKAGRHERVRIWLNDGTALCFNDTRKFGRMYLLSDPLKVTGRLGPEPLEKSTTPNLIISALSGKRGAIKPLLLKQSFLAGLGNIYADESLWFARIHPLNRADRIKAEEARDLLKAIRLVLRKAIADNGTDFGDKVIRDGGYSPRAYGRTGEPCLRCGAAIRRIVVGQRSTHFCPKCQKRRS